MHIDIFTLFPEMFQGPFEHSMVKRAIEQGIVSIELHNIRDYATDRHHTVDDYPYGGGAGMVLKPQPAFDAIEAVLGDERAAIPIVLLSPQGRRFSQAIAQELASQPRLALLCGHYEGVDERIREHLATDEITIGDYVLTGGELPAMVVVDAVVRLIPGTLGSGASLEQESFSHGLLEYPHYTRPAEFRGWTVPDILLSGNHGEIARWRREQSLLRTALRRPDLLAQAPLSVADVRFLQEEVVARRGIDIPDLPSEPRQEA